MHPEEFLDDTQKPDSECQNDDDVRSGEKDDEDDDASNSSCHRSPWARLVALERSNPDISIRERDTVVGRAHVNGNRRVSKFHCRILKDSTGEVLLSNLSNNGTMMNELLLNNGQRCSLQHGDEISLGRRGSGAPQYIWHVLDMNSRCGKKRPNEFGECNARLDNVKQLKFSKLRDGFNCCICLNIWHDVVTVAPCLHNFCNGCFSEWYKKKGGSSCNRPQCPQCRELVVFVKKNPTLSDIIEDYLQEVPSLRRNPEETDSLDQRAIVGNNFVKIGSPSNTFTSDDDDDDDDDYSADNEGICLQCYRSNTREQVGDEFSCGPETLHLQCCSCSRFLPRRPDLNVPQKCAGCDQVFCGLYWRSQNMSIIDPLASCMMKKVTERTGDILPSEAFARNTYEQDIIRRYLQERGLHINNVLTEWLQKMDRGEIAGIDLPNNPQVQYMDTYFCNSCEEHIVCELLYRFRSSLPKNELPPDVAARPDCWYGRLCRTQSHKYSHAAKLNHICEPTSRSTSR
ncbi:hypothetical protein KP509_19G058700 [Ceratopteris richardii]|uniref:RING-type E3 ubiquitin transferase n=1 Tax=Ceratopteris richardii TaxID=49495 RepID=A0A8T2SMP0_CERRI|nr:hypothetical protein KP509_19G058700 [Ceratopteris richardii]